MNIEQLNGCSLNFGFDSFGKSNYGEPSWITIEVLNGIAKVTNLTIFPEDEEVTEHFTEGQLARFQWSFGVHDTEGQFCIYAIDTNDEMLSCTITEGDWDVNDYDKECDLGGLIGQLTSEGWTLPKTFVQFLYSIYQDAINFRLS
tara:strand:+ start:274 stop:708 length:435 start_codon:yes stop_codon:yes gene_type:complete